MRYFVIFLILIGTFGIAHAQNSTIHLSGGAITNDKTVYPVPWEARPPLQQLRDGVSINVIKCNSGLELVVRLFDDSPACVRANTKQILVERGWASAEPVMTQEISCNVAYKKIIPGPVVLPSCPISSPQIMVSNRDSAGFSGAFHSNSAVLDTYVIEAGHNGTITYSLDLSYPEMPAGFENNHVRNTNITNYAQFIHYKTLDLNDLENYPETTLKRDSGSFATCFETPYGPSCRGEITNSHTVNAYVYDHPGIRASFDKQSEFLTANKTTSLSVMFSVDKDAQLGTYVVVLPPGLCSGGGIMLTVVCPEAGGEQ